MSSAKIISSNSHIDYVARIYEEPVDGDELEFATFVSFQLDPAKLVGVIYDSKLVNPQVNSYTPRLSRRSTLGDLSSDALHEPGVLIGIILLGFVNKDGRVVHGIPPQVIPHGIELRRMTATDVREFHREPDGGLKLHYYSQVLGNTGLLGVPLMESIIDQLKSGCEPDERRRLEVLRQTLKWQRTIGSLR